MFSKVLFEEEEAKWEDCRYGDILKQLLEDLNYKEVLRVDFDFDYAGHVDLDVLLKDGRVFSYLYYYGSCSGCDEWEDRDLSWDEIKGVMKTEATFFDDIGQYKKWRERCKKGVK